MSVNRAWRRFAYGLCFACFGAGGALIRFVIFPALLLSVRQETQRTYYSRRMISALFRFFIALVSFCGAIEFRVRHAERLRGSGLLILANHPTLLDVVLLISLIENASCIVKAELFEHFATCGPLKAAGYLCNGNENLLAQCHDVMAGGANLVIFPEGTRTPVDGQLHFGRGAANVAVRLKKDVTPVFIACEPLTLMKGEKWYHVPVKKAVITLTVQETIPVTPYISPAQPETLAARRLNRDLEKYFTDGIKQ